MPGPLEGVKVVEVGMWVAGPAAAGILADWGADVVKIEPPEKGDPARSYQRLFGEPMPDNPPFELDNRSKRSVVLDLRVPEALEVALQLVDDADVFVTNLRQSALARFGIDPESLAARNPRLVYCLITGYGMEGEEADRPAYDIGGFWSRSSMADLLTPPGSDPPFQRGGMGDHSTASSAAAAVCAALYSRERTGEGQLVSTSLLRQGMYAVGFDVGITLSWGAHIGIGLRQTMGNPAMNNYMCGDGKRFWIIGQQAERHWPPLARAVGRPEWLTDERFATRAGRASNAAELIGLLDEIFATRTLDEWGEIFDAEEDFFWARVNTVDDLLVDPQVHAAGGFVDVPDEDGGALRVATPADFGGTPWAPRHRAPKLGEHTVEVLGELGLDVAAVDALVAAGATDLSEGSSDQGF